MRLRNFFSEEYFCYFCYLVNCAKSLSLINNSVYYPVICKWYLQTCYNASKFPGRNNQTSLNWMGLPPGTL